MSLGPLIWSILWGVLLVLFGLLAVFVGFALGPLDADPLITPSPLAMSRIEVTFRDPGVDVVLFLDLGDLSDDRAQLLMVAGGPTRAADFRVRVEGAGLGVREPFQDHGRWSKEFVGTVYADEDGYREAREARTDTELRLARLLLPIAEVRLPPNYYGGTGDQVRIALPLVSVTGYALGEDQLPDTDWNGARTGEVGVIIESAALVPLRTEASNPPQTGAGLWKSNRYIQLTYLATNPVSESKSRRLLLFSGIAIGLGASAFVGGLQQLVDSFTRSRSLATDIGAAPPRRRS